MAIPTSALHAGALLAPDSLYDWYTTENYSRRCIAPSVVIAFHPSFILSCCHSKQQVPRPTLRDTDTNAGHSPKSPVNSHPINGRGCSGCRWLFGCRLFVFRSFVDVAILWPRLFGERLLGHRWVTSGGPFGRNLFKIVELVLVLVLRPVSLHMGAMPSWPLLAFAAFTCVATNFVLSKWSSMLSTRGNHGGVDRMVQHTVDRSLTWRQHLNLGLLGAGNALCEEAASRGLAAYELRHCAAFGPHAANFLQAVQFGLWHFHGIPSGFAGVALTWLYGLIMGWLCMATGGLGLAVLIHAIADYFIFSVIARRKFATGGEAGAKKAD